jgi:hypothetical protein
LNRDGRDETEDRGLAMVEIHCICCGAELSAHYAHPRPVTNAICGGCARDMMRARLALRVIRRRHRLSMTR